MIALLLVILYVAIGVYLMFVDIATPGFKEMIENARQEAGMSEEDLESKMFSIKCVIVATWPIGLMEKYITSKEEE